MTTEQTVPQSDDGREVTRCPATHPHHGRCYDLAGHDGKHHVSAYDEYDEYDHEWTDERAAAVAREMENPTPRCWCGRTFATQEALNEHVAFWADDDTTEEPVRTLTAVERDAEQYIAPLGVGEPWHDPNAELLRVEGGE